MTKLFQYMLETKGTICVILLLLMIQAYCELTLPSYTSDIVDVGIAQGGIENATPDLLARYAADGVDLHQVQMDYLLNTGGKMLCFAFLGMTATILISFLSARSGAFIGKTLRERVFERVISFSGKEMDRFSTASLITRCTNDIQQVQIVVTIMLRMVLFAPIMGIGGIIKVSRTDTGLDWIVVLAVLLVLCLVGVLMYVTLPKFKSMQTLIDRLNLVSREILTGIPVIRAFSREEFEEKRFAVANEDLRRTQLFTTRVMSLMFPSMMFIMNGVTVLILWFGSKGVDRGNLMVGDMMAFINYTMMIVMSFLMLTMISILLPRAGVAAARIDEVLTTTPSICDRDKPLEHDGSFTGRLAFHDVSFRYPDAEADVLEHISFTANPGETTAIIGSTGCGKSTLIHLIPRFYDVKEGSITLDGIDIRDLPQKKLRSLIGLVPQKGILFSGTIASNIKFADANIPDETMKKAAHIAQAEDFIEKKEDSYDSPIAQGGSNVSGGQKQRLSIARAIAKNPKIFLFDDSFSALDYKTDSLLRKALATQMKHATVIIVAQRISTILHADRIIVLDDGKIAGTGTHEELLRSCEAYREIASSQLSEAELNQKGGMA